MGKFKAKNFNELADDLLEIAKRNEEMLKELGRELTQPMLQATLLIASRAKEITTEKGHVVTGAYRRAWNGQLLPKRRDVVRGETGNFMEYAPMVEALPDGGVLEPAFEESTDKVTKLLKDKGLEPVLARWGR